MADSLYGTLKPGKADHLCRNDCGCKCSDRRKDHYCGWDCECPSFYRPEEVPDGV